MPIKYRDGKITCDTDGLTIRFYYFPWGDKRVLYQSIREVRQFRLDRGVFSGRFRTWGSGDLVHWFNLDPARHQKKVGFVLDLGRRFRPVVTPDDPEALRRIFEEEGLALTEGIG